MKSRERRDPGKAMAVSSRVKIMLALNSGGICAYPGCGVQLVVEREEDKDFHIGEAAHIYGENPGSARYDESMTDDQRNSLRNLVYLCPTVHVRIDKDVDNWPPQKLQKMKVNHEMKIRQAIQERFADVAFGDLKKGRALGGGQAPANNGKFDSIAVNEKIDKNALSNGSRHIILQGLASRETVSEYVKMESQQDPDFSLRLIAGFREKYLSLREEGEKDDDLFQLMCAFATQSLHGFADRAAVLAVLVYFFEICDVFET